MSGLFVLAVAEAGARARQGHTGEVHHNGESVAVTYVRGSYVVEPSSLFSDGTLAASVADLLRRHAPSVEGEPA